MWTINNRVCTRYHNRMACTPGTYSPLRCTTIMVSFKVPKKVNLNVVLSFVSNRVYIFTVKNVTEINNNSARNVRRAVVCLVVMRGRQKKKNVLMERKTLILYTRSVDKAFEF